MGQSPDDAVSETIVGNLRDKKLLNDEKSVGLARRISTGSLRPLDWRSLAESDNRGEKKDVATD